MKKRDHAYGSPIYAAARADAKATGGDTCTDHNRVSADSASVTDNAGHREA